MYKEKYEKAELEIISFEAQDVIRTSICTGTDCGDDGGF